MPRNLSSLCSRLGVPPVAWVSCCWSRPGKVVPRLVFEAQRPNAAACAANLAQRLHADLNVLPGEVLRDQTVTLFSALDHIWPVASNVSTARQYPFTGS